jgi:hypothetical protein
MDSDLLNKVDSFYRMAAVLQAPKTIVKEMTEWAYSIYCGAMLPIIETRMRELLPEKRKHKKELDRLAMARAVCMKHYNPDNTNPQYFVLGLEELSYFTPQELKEKYPDGEPAIEAKFFFDPKEVEAVGRGNWRGLFNGSIFINYPIMPVKYISDELLGRILAVLSKTVHHEILHMVQLYLKTVKDLQDLGGMPPRKLRERAYDFTDPSKEEAPHSLQDIEFYTNLNDSVTRFRSVLPKFPATLHKMLFKTWIGQGSLEELERLTMQEYRRDKSLWQKWFGARNLREIMPQDLIYVQTGMDFFGALKAHQPGKYRKAVIEFYKAVQNQI